MLWCYLYMEDVDGEEHKIAPSVGADADMRGGRKGERIDFAEQT